MCGASIKCSSTIWTYVYIVDAGLFSPKYMFDVRICGFKHWQSVVYQKRMQERPTSAFIKELTCAAAFDIPHSLVIQVYIYMYYVICIWPTTAWRRSAPRMPTLLCAGYELWPIRTLHMFSKTYSNCMREIDVLVWANNKTFICLLGMSWEHFIILPLIFGYMWAVKTFGHVFFNQNYLWYLPS